MGMPPIPVILLFPLACLSKIVPLLMVFSEVPLVRLILSVVPFVRIVVSLVFVTCSVLPLVALAASLLCNCHCWNNYGGDQQTSRKMMKHVVLLKPFWQTHKALK